MTSGSIGFSLYLHIAGVKGKTCFSNKQCMSRIECAATVVAVRISAECHKALQGIPSCKDFI